MKVVRLEKEVREYKILQGSFCSVSKKFSKEEK
jgi:hypothetical protein